jgi:alcohol dehydrogenase
MRQLTYAGGSTIEWWDVPEPKLQDDRDALVQPLAVTRCDLDLIIAVGKSGLPGPFALGHETAGRVVDVGDAVQNFVPGDLVIVPFQISCGDCERCRRGHTNACISVPFRSSYGPEAVMWRRIWRRVVRSHPRPLCRSHAGPAARGSRAVADSRAGRWRHRRL